VDLLVQVTLMSNYLIALMVGAGVCLFVAWLGYRSHQRARASKLEARRKRDAANAAQAEAQRMAEEKAIQEELQRLAENQRTARLEATRLAQEEAARVQAAKDAERVQAARAFAAEQKALAEAARAAEAARLAAAPPERTSAAVHAEAALAQAARSSRAETVRPKKKQKSQIVVMVADDSKIVRVKTGRLLERQEYRVLCAEDGLEAVKQLQTDVPDVLITDVEMPGMDGFELTRHVRQNPRTAHIPVIMITAADDKHRDEAQRAGVNVLLGKPYQEEELLDHIRTAMSCGETQAGAFA
jgi:CheY-like chemotaxis protein